jgi:hypothetical protein
MWWINFRRGSEVVGIGGTVDYSEGKEVDARCAALIPRSFLGRLLLPDEALKLGRSLLTEHAPAAQRRH